MPTVSVVEVNIDREEIDGTLKKFEISEGSVIFEAIDDQGLQLPHGCLAGSCGSCKIIILEGGDTLQKMSYVENNTIEAVTEMLTKEKGQKFVSNATIRLSCRARIGDKDVKIGIIK